MIWIETTFINRDKEKERSSQGIELTPLIPESYYQKVYEHVLNKYVMFGTICNPSEFSVKNVTEIGWGISTTTIKADIYYHSIKIAYFEQHSDLIKDRKDKVFVLFFDDKYDEICQTAGKIINNTTTKSKNKDKPVPIYSDSELIYEFFLYLTLCYISKNYDKCVKVVHAGVKKAAVITVNNASCDVKSFVFELAQKLPYGIHVIPYKDNQTLVCIFLDIEERANSDNIGNLTRNFLTDKDYDEVELLTSYEVTKTFDTEDAGKQKEILFKSLDLHAARSALNEACEEFYDYTPDEMLFSLERICSFSLNNEEIEIIRDTLIDSNSDDFATRICLYTAKSDCCSENIHQSFFLHTL